MRGIIAALVALSVLAGIAGATFAADKFPQDYWKRQQDNLP